MNEQSINESLRSLRFLHNLCILVAAAVLVLGLAPDPSKNYNAALKELAALRQIQTRQQDYGAYVRDQIAFDHYDDKLLKSLVRAAGGQIDSNLKELPVFVSDWGFPNADLADLDHFFSNSQRIAVLNVDFDRRYQSDWIKFFRQQLATQQRPWKYRVVLVGIRPLLPAGELPDGSQIMSWGDLTPQRLRGATMMLQFSSAGNPDFQVQLPISAQFSLGASKTGQFALAWLKSTTTGRQIVDSTTNTIFPRLKKLSSWNRLALMNAETAIGYVQQRLDSIDAETISFFGVSVNKTIAIWAGPLATLSLAFVFLLHLTNFQQHSEGAENVCRFPWIAAFPGLPSGATSYISAFLPAIASTCLILAYGLPHTLSFDFGALFAMGSTLIGAMTCLQLHNFRREHIGRTGNRPEDPRTLCAGGGPC